MLSLVTSFSSYDFKPGRVTLALSIIPLLPPTGDVEVSGDVSPERWKQMWPVGVNAGLVEWYGKARGLKYADSTNAPAQYLTVITPRGSVHAAADWLHGDKAESELQGFRWRSCEAEILKAIPRYVELLRDLGVSGSLQVGISLLQTRNTRLEAAELGASDIHASARTVMADKIVTDEITIPANLDTKQSKAVATLVKPAMKHIWGEYNLPPLTYDNGIHG